MSISDWNSDVCSSDLAGVVHTVVEGNLLVLESFLDLGDDGRGILRPQTKEIAYPMLSAPCRKQFFYQEIEGKERAQTIEMEPLYVKVDVDAGSIRLRQDGTITDRKSTRLNSSH